MLAGKLIACQYRPMNHPLRLAVFVLSVLLATNSFAAEKKASKQQQRRTNADDMWVTKVDPASLPPGVTHHTYFSQSMKHDVGYCIYLPPGYSNDQTKRYPVIYHLHGATGNETRALYSAQVLNEGILAGRWPEMIMVFPNGGRVTMYQDSADGRFMAETTFIKELIPHIDQTYRTIGKREGRCIEGFSMGGRGSTHLAMKFPELFCSFFNQSGNVFHTAVITDKEKEKPEQYPLGFLGSDPEKLKANDPYISLTNNIAKIKGKMRIQIACGTKDGEHLPSVREYHETLVKLGVDHTYFEIEGLAHNQHQMIDTYKPIWFDYHVESLRRNGTLPRPPKTNQ